MGGNAPQIEVSTFKDAKIAIISSRWHLDICNNLIAGANRALVEAKVEGIELQMVPGAFEIPLAAQYAFERGFDGVVALGLILKGETPHFEYVCQGVTQGIVDVSLKFSKPIGYGVLMCNEMSQAVARSGSIGSTEDKGYDSAVAVLELLRLRN